MVAWPEFRSTASHFWYEAKTASRTEEFMATGKHAMELGTPFTVFFAEVD